MSSKKSRDKKRLNAAYLREAVREKRQQEHICPECGEKGEYHWVQTELLTLEQFIKGIPAGGFWICPKFYDPETKQRIAP